MNWTALYDDKTEYNSGNHKWEDLPSSGFIKLIITLPAGGKMQVSGWDFYALKKLKNGIRIAYWKDTVANDIDGVPMHEPHLDKGGVRYFFDNGTANKVIYHNAVDIYTGITATDIKAGKWVTDELAKEMGIL